MLNRKSILVSLLASAALIASHAVFASAPGTLDTSFGGDGLVATSFNPDDASAEAVIQQPDGKLVVAGYVDTAIPNETNLIVMRYNDFNGSLDTSFGNNGLLELSYAAGIRATALARQSDGKLLVAGWVRRASSNDELVVIRITTTGAVDTTFSGDGLATAVMGTATARAFALISRSDGSVWVAGYTSSSGTNKEDFMLVKFNSSGQLDTTFGSGGGLLTNISDDTDKAYAMIKQTDGKVLLVGEANVLFNSIRSRDFALVRYTTAGKLDTSFGSSGKLATAFSTNDDAVARAALQQKDGRLVVVGSSSNGVDRDIAVARYLQNGALDTSFSVDGKVLTDLGGNDIATGVTQQLDGKLLVSGSNNNETFLVRYTTAGALDASFGVGGKLIAPLPDVLGMSSMVQQADGQIVLAGYSYSSGNYVVALLRFLFDDDDDDGVLDVADNCQYVANPDQINTDENAISGDENGDACDDDDDADGVDDVDDAFPLDPTESVDTDGDGTGNNADLDDDNDGVPDVDDPFPLDPFLLNRVTGDSKGDTAGYSVAIVGDVDGDGFADTLVGAPKNDVILPPATKPALDVGSAYLSSGQTLAVLHTFNGAAKGDEFGGAVALAGDVNNDGTPDLIIAAPKADQLDPLTGKVLVKDRGAVTVYSGADFSVLFTLNGEAAGDGFGISVAAAGDVDTDTYDDIVVGAWKADGVVPVTLKPIKDAGAAYLYSGQTGNLLHKFDGEAKGDYFGYSVAAGSDLDHDTVSEVSIGAYKHDPLDGITNKPRTDAGSVYVYSSASPSYTLVKRLDGAAKGDNFGFAQAAINNGQDAFADLLVGSPKADVVTSKKYSDAGQVALFADAAGIPVYPAVHAVSPQAGARFGNALAAAGDVNAADGVDFVVGAPKADVIAIDGKKWVNAGQVSVHRADNGTPVFVYDGRYKAGQAGFCVSGGGDHNDDGYSDVLIGSPFATFDNFSKAGVAEVISGKEASEAAIP